MNKDLKEEVDTFKPILSQTPGVIDNIKDTGEGAGPLTDLILDQSGNINVSETDEPDTGHGDGQDVEPSDQPNELGKKLKKDEKGNKTASEKNNDKKPRRKGGFDIKFVNDGIDAPRASYKSEKRVIEINLDHPQLSKALELVGNDVDDKNFIKLAYEAGIQEHIIASTIEKSARGLMEDSLDDGMIEVQRRTDKLSRKMAEIYDSL